MATVSVEDPSRRSSMGVVEAELLSFGFVVIALSLIHIYFEGSSEEKKAKALLSTLGIDYDSIAME